MTQQSQSRGACKGEGRNRPSPPGRGTQRCANGFQILISKTQAGLGRAVKEPLLISCGESLSAEQDSEASCESSLSPAIFLLGQFVPITGHCSCRWRGKRTRSVLRSPGGGLAPLAGSVGRNRDRRRELSTLGRLVTKMNGAQKRMNKMLR